MPNSLKTDDETPEIREKRLRWACRRGMLELDLLLLPFFIHYYHQLSLRDQQVFEKLLEYPDPELHAYLTGVQQCDDSEQQALCNQIRSTNRC